MEFFILPDRTDAPPLVPRLVRRPEPRVLHHASGRPWLVGDWTDDEIVYAEHGERRLVLLGGADTDAASLAAALRATTTLTDLSRLARRVAGCHHLIASFAGRVRAQGSLATVRQIHHARIDGVVVGADRAYGLARATGHAVDTVALALRMTTPLPPWPLTDRCSWLGVAQTPAGSYLALEPGGEARTVPWWTPPAAEVAPNEGAATLGDAIRRAVEARTRGGGVLSADLSGDPASTGLCFTAGRSESATTVLATHLAAGDDGEAGRRRAALAAGLLPAARHHVLDAADLPSWYDPTADPDPAPDAPFIRVGERARLAHLARAYAELGSTRHLVAHGGGELFDVAPSSLHTLARQHPRAALRRLLTDHPSRRGQLWPTLRALADRSSFADALVAGGNDLTAASRSADPAVALGWGTGARMPAWATPAAIDAVRTRFHAAAVQAVPLSPGRDRHRTLDLVRRAGEVLRQVDVFTRAHGIAWEAPYLDDHVIEAAMSIRLADRSAPRAGRRPLLDAALRDTVPDQVRARGSATGSGAEPAAGLHRHRRALLDLSEDMLLAQAGLVDAAAFRRAVLSPQSTAHPATAIDATLACEFWLRSVAAAAPAAVTAEGAR